MRDRILRLQSDSAALTRFQPDQRAGDGRPFAAADTVLTLHYSARCNALWDSGVLEQQIRKPGRIGYGFTEDRPPAAVWIGWRA
jgi:hypothetical protein